MIYSDSASISKFNVSVQIISEDPSFGKNFTSREPAKFLSLKVSWGQQTNLTHSELQLPLHKWERKEIWKINQIGNGMLQHWKLNTLQKWLSVTIKFIGVSVKILFTFAWMVEWLNAYLSQKYQSKWSPGEKKNIEKATSSKNFGFYRTQVKNSVSNTFHMYMESIPLL